MNIDSVNCNTQSASHSPENFNWQDKLAVTAWAVAASALPILWEGGGIISKARDNPAVSFAVGAVYTGVVMSGVAAQHKWTLSKSAHFKAFRNLLWVGSVCDAFKSLSTGWGAPLLPGLSPVYAFTLGISLGELLPAWVEKQAPALPSETASNVVDKVDSVIRAMDSVVVGQDTAKRKLAESVVLSRLHSGDEKASSALNILLAAREGVDRGAMVEALATEMQRPLVTVDVSSLTSTGYLGNSFSDVVYSKLLDESKTRDLAEQGIVVLSNIESAWSHSVFSGVSPSAKVLDDIISGMKGGTVDFASRPFNTKKLTFILEGDFTQLRRHDGVINRESIQHQGMPSSLVQLLSQVIDTEVPTVEDLKGMLWLQGRKSNLASYTKQFARCGVKLEVDEEVVDRVVERVGRIGASSLDSTVRALLQDRLVERMRTVGAIAEGGSTEIMRLTLDDWNASQPGIEEARREHVPSMEELREALEEQVIGQASPKQTLLEAIYFHYLRTRQGSTLPKGNVLLAGPSGTGKTYMVEVLSKAVGIPMISMDASRLTGAGVVGSSVEDAIALLLERCNGNVAEAEKGIVFLDEIDKLLESSWTSRVIQNQLLRMLEGDKVTVRFQGKKKTVNTENILFITAGAFSKFPQVYSTERLDHQQLISCGMSPEFLGRISRIDRLESLTADHLREYLLTKDSSPLKKWQEEFERIGSTLILSDKTLDDVISRSLGKVTGVRGLHFELQELLSSVLIEQLSRPKEDRTVSRL